MVKIAINGFGRIGRAVFKALLERYPREIEIVAINDLTDAPTLAHLLKYDSVFGIYPRNIEATASSIMIDGTSIPVSAIKDPLVLPWKDLKVDIVLECTGIFTSSDKAQAHIEAGAKHVILSAPASDDTPTFVLGVNDADLKKDMQVVSNASCTTNCLAPLVHILEKHIGIVHGTMITTHSYTQDQRLHDAPHKDLRRARNALMSMIPTTTGAAKTVTKVLPQLQGKLDGLSIRVPTPDVSLVMFTCELKKSVGSLDEVKQIFMKEIQGGLSDIIAWTNEPLVSVDYVGNSHSAIIDEGASLLVDGSSLTLSAWYDNEWGYSCRLADIAARLGKL